MDYTDNAEKLELALLPLADGRQVALPLTLLAEVRQINPADRGGDDLGSFKWRGHDLPISTLEELCGLPVPSPEQLITIGVFRASQGASQPFRAIAFCGLASHNLVGAEQLHDIEAPTEGNFKGAAEVDGVTYLVPDLSVLSYKDSQQVH